MRNLTETIKRKSDQYAAIELQLLAHCEELDDKQAEIVALRDKIAEAVVFTPPSPPAPRNTSTSNSGVTQTALHFCRQ